MRKSDVDGVYLYLALVLGIAEAFLVSIARWSFGYVDSGTLYTFSL
jgi:hypothetical protein